MKKINEREILENNLKVLNIKKLHSKNEDAESNQEVVLYNMKKQIRELEDKVLG